MQRHYDASSMNPLKLSLIKEKDCLRKQYYREKQQAFQQKKRGGITEIDD